jgi:hypothetical protein
MTDRTGPALLVAALAVMVVAAAAGLWLPERLLAPSDADIEAAVDGLVPAGAEVTDRAAGPQGAIPEPGPYRAYVEYEAPGDRDTRAAKLEAHALELGWSVTDRAAMPGAVVVELECDSVLEALDRRYKRLIEQLEPAGVAKSFAAFRVLASVASRKDFLRCRSDVSR